MSAAFTPGQRVTVQGVPDFPAAEGATGTVERIIPGWGQGRTVSVMLDGRLAGVCRFMFAPTELQAAGR